MLTHRELLDRIEELESLVEKDAAYFRRKYNRLMKQRRKAFRSLNFHVAAYFVVNGFMVGIYFYTGDGFFWPGFAMAGWGLSFLLHIANFQFRYGFNRNAYDQKIKKQLANEKNGL